MGAGWETPLLVVLGSFITFLSARYWALQAGAIKEAERLAVEHQKLVDRVYETEKQICLLKQRIGVGCK